MNRLTLIRTRFRMTATMLQTIDAAARVADLTSPAWVRQVIADRLGMTDPTDLHPIQRYGGTGPDAAALMALRLQLNQLGGLLTQLAKVSRKNGDTALHADAEGTLAEVRDSIGIISKWQEERRQR